MSRPTSKSFGIYAFEPPMYTCFPFYFLYVVVVTRCTPGQRGISSLYEQTPASETRCRPRERELAPGT
nr:putative S protein [Maize chlorotic dwarf virus]